VFLEIDLQAGTWDPLYDRASPRYAELEPPRREELDELGFGPLEHPLGRAWLRVTDPDSWGVRGDEKTRGLLWCDGEVEREEDTDTLGQLVVMETNAGKNVKSARGGSWWKWKRGSERKRDGNEYQGGDATKMRRACATMSRLDGHKMLFQSFGRDEPRWNQVEFPAGGEARRELFLADRV